MGSYPITIEVALFITFQLNYLRFKKHSFVYLATATSVCIYTWKLTWIILSPI